MFNTLFPPKEFTTTEMNLIAEQLQKPELRKYLTHLAVESLKSIASGMPKQDETAESYLRRQATVAGGMGVCEALLAIEPVKASS